MAEPTVAVPELAAVVGTSLRVEHPASMRVRVSPSGSPLTGRAHGVVELDGVPADGPNPLGNDQDWALVYALGSGLVP